VNKKKRVNYAINNFKSMVMLYCCCLHMQEASEMKPNKIIVEKCSLILGTVLTPKMSAHEQMRQMLDQLMGTGRDGENNRYKVHFTDPRVCKSFLLACCPHDILASTRMDLGDCPKIHDLALRADFENASQKKDYFYDVDV
ncbi:unnamed protein product, partial [Ixodes pacificus]